jgi:hypothetical protein
MSVERTFSIIKPDAVASGHAGEILAFSNWKVSDRGAADDALSQRRPRVSTRCIASGRFSPAW